MKSDAGWMARADCRDMPTGWWTDTDMSVHSNMWNTTENHLAIEICQTRPVAQECLLYCISKERTGLPHRWGIYAGLTPAKRHRLITSQQRATA